MDDRLQKREWGNGIPNYKESDLMTKEEIHDFGVQIVGGILQKDGYEILAYQPQYNAMPNIISQKDNKLYSIVVRADIAPINPKINTRDKYSNIAYSKIKKMIPCYASVSFGSIDPARFDNSIALVGDGYYANYTGFVELEDKKPKTGTEEYIIYTLATIGIYFQFREFDKVKDYISNDCIIKNMIDGDLIDNNASEYLINGFIKYPLKSHNLIVFDKQYKTQIMGHEKEPFNKDEIKAIANNIGLIIITEAPLYANDDPGILFHVDFNDQGKINKIEILDPRIIKFSFQNE